MVAANPSLLGVVLPRLVASTVIAAAMVLTAKASPEVSLVVLPPPATAEEEREAELPASPGEGPHGSPSRSELEVPEGDEAGTESERLPVACETEVVEIPSDDEADDEVEPPVLS